MQHERGHEAPQQLRTAGPCARQGGGGRIIATVALEVDDAAGAGDVARAQRKVEQDLGAVAENVDEQFVTGRLYALVTSRPGQCGRCDGYVLEGKELEFYVKRMARKKK